MTNKKNAKEFAEFWKGKGYEKGESQTFWLSLLRDVLGVDKPHEFISFEDQVMLDHTSFIDGFISSTHVLIEQKSIDKDLRKAIKQSDGTFLTPFQQGKRYSAELPYSQRPRWIVTCNFKEFLIYDMEKPNGDPESILLKDLEKECYRLQFVVDAGNENIKKEMEISIKAGELVGVLYDALFEQYINKDDEQSLKSLNMLCVRLVFCLYAEDSDLFGERLAFHNYLQSFAVKDVRRALIDLFKVLDTEPQNRDPYLDDELAKFPYVNGGLFANEEIEIPQFNQKIVDIILHQASEDFDWSEISPTIFGAVFESTLNPETRRSGGMHYTSIENIHKVIDPLFLDDFNDELAKIKEIKVERTKKLKLEEFRKKLGSLTFLDPACGSGNFLTEAYISLRRLENDALLTLTKGQAMFDFGDVIKVSISQFYGIEINDFAVTVAKTALWISESQMMKETEMIISHNLEFFPLKSYANIIEANALQIDWESVVPKDKLNYIMGNPPFVGARLMDKNQKADVDLIFGKWKNAGNLDYVSCWYKKTTDMIKDTNIRSALVSTNSICQGESVANLWKPLFDMGVHIDFAHTTFRWDSEASLKAKVHCVIVGFSIAQNNKPKVLYSADRFQIVKNINAYLIDADNVFIESRRTVICKVSEMVFGSMPNDGGFLSNYSDDEKNEIIKKYPQSEVCFKQIVGAAEFINDKIRWCLWLKNISPNLIKSIPPILKAVNDVKVLRENSDRDATKKLAEYPMIFGEIRQPENGNYLLVPSTSSERRKYVPIGFLSSDIISSNANLIIPNATLYHFGILTSNVHMAWMRAVAGRLKSDYRYSASIVYNNFVWPTQTKEQQEKIEKT
ncbi:MAG: N-6 DNA methylase, partial [Clostridia bacterium]|nr:N-6 DNA methylase [Clostridia bacterium]